MGIFNSILGRPSDTGKATSSLADALRSFAPRSATAAYAIAKAIREAPAPLATPVPAPVTDIRSEIEKAIRENPTRDGASNDEYVSLLADAIAKAMQAAPAPLATAPAGKGIAVVDAAIKAAIAQGKTAADFDSVATDLIGAAIRFRDEAPELAAIIEEGQRRSGGKGWLHEVPDLVRERWLAMQPAAAPTTAPAAR